MLLELVALGSQCRSLLVPLFLQLLDYILLAFTLFAAFFCLLLQELLLTLQIFSFGIECSDLFFEILVVVFGLFIGLVELGKLLAVVLQYFEQLFLLFFLFLRLFEVDVGFLLNLHLLLRDVFLDLVLDRSSVDVLIRDLLVHQNRLLADFLHQVLEFEL